MWCKLGLDLLLYTYCTTVLTTTLLASTYLFVKNNNNVVDVHLNMHNGDGATKGDGVQRHVTSNVLHVLIIMCL